MASFILSYLLYLVRYTNVSITKDERINMVVGIRLSLSVVLVASCSGRLLTIYTMARVKNNPLLKGVSGKIGDAFVVKQYRYGTVISAVPDMSRVKKSKLQKVKQSGFAEAVAYAQSIVRNPKKKAAYARKLPPGKTVYHAAIQEYLATQNKKNNS